MANQKKKKIVTTKIAAKPKADVKGRGVAVMQAKKTVAAKSKPHPVSSHVPEAKKKQAGLPLPAKSQAQAGKPIEKERAKGKREPVKQSKLEEVEDVAPLPIEKERRRGPIRFSERLGVIRSRHEAIKRELDRIRDALDVETEEVDTRS